MVDILEKAMTAAEYRALPESMIRQHLIDGFLIQEPCPTDEHQRLVLNLAGSLRAWAKRTGLGSVRIAPLDVWLTEETAVQPDVFVVLNGKRHLLRSDGTHGGPDLVVEVLSPSTAAFNRKKKRGLYANHGVREMWLVDPRLRQVEIYRFDQSWDSPVQTIREGKWLASPLLPAFRIRVSEIFEA